MKMDMITNVTEYEAVAKENLPKMVYDFYASGAEDQWTLKENRNAFSRILFRLRILVDLSKIDLTTTVLGFKISMPIMIAPTAKQKMAHPEASRGVSKDAQGFFKNLGACTVSMAELVTILTALELPWQRGASYDFVGIRFPRRVSL
ncbi:hypothetical protein JHK87_020824 [Glycine soja]|nr:hypothetical protein JHK87_020824 [Glycine soja]